MPIVDDFLSQPNPENSRVAVETLVTTNKVVVAGEVRGPDGYDCQYEELARNAIRDIGYEQSGFHWKNLSFRVLCSQSVSRYSSRSRLVCR
jgi:S-adenosylmethionine synthetase